MTGGVNRKLVWVGIASSLVGVFDIIALLVIINTWVSVEAYGVVGFAVWMFPILDQLTDLGLGGAVVQHDDVDETTVSTVFWINLAAATGLFALLAIVGPPLAEALTGHRVVGYLLLVYGTKLLWQNVYFIPMAQMKRALRFEELSVIRMVANFAELIGKIGFAWAGFGIWCFVLGPLCRVLVSGVGTQLCHPWRPRAVFRPAAARRALGFGVRTSASQLLFNLYTNVDYPIVGYYFGTTSLGLYRLAYDVALEPVRVLSEVIVAVAFPVFARLRHARDQVIAQFVAFTRLNIVVVMTYAVIVAIAAPEVVAVFLPGNGGAVTAMRVLCAVGVLRALSFVVPPLLDGLGHPERTLRYMVVAAVVLPAAYVVAAVTLGDRLGFLAVAVAWAVGYPVAFVVLIALAADTLGWSVRGYLRAIAGVTACVAGGGLVGLGVHAALAGSVGPGLRLAAVAAAALVTTAVLLAHTQDLGPRALVKAFRER